MTARDLLASESRIGDAQLRELRHHTIEFFYAAQWTHAHAMQRSIAIGLESKPAR